MVSFEASCESIHGFRCTGNGMAMPRRAMKDLGFQACCLRCDAPDIVGGERCRNCIKHHTKVRDLIAKAPQSDENLHCGSHLGYLGGNNDLEQ